MNVQINQLVKTLLQKESIEQCSLQELQQYAERHPYFGAAQLLLTKKLQTEDPGRYEEQLQKTYLFFHNPMWVEHLLNENGTVHITNGKEAAVANLSAEIPAGNNKEQEAEPVSTPVSSPEPLAAFIAVENKINNGVDTVKEESPVAVVDSSIEEKEPAKEAKEEPVIPQPKTISGADLLFQPYHTVDYFASQGIKMKDEEKPVDKFGQQLKSFTDWIRSMKRLPLSEITKHIDSGSEQNVEVLAEHSLEEREVVTEAMAEVWEKQKNYEKAIAIYRKLSLLDPPKSAYFAAKIEELKKFN